jgi:hypothetical protein
MIDYAKYLIENDLVSEFRHTHGIRRDPDKELPEIETE